MSDDLSSSEVDYTTDIRRPELITIAQIFLEFIWIIRSIVECCIIFTIFRTCIVERIATGCDDDRLDLLSEISIRHFTESLEIVLDGEGIDREELSVLIAHGDPPTEYIVIVSTGHVPERYSIPGHYTYDITLEGELSCSIFFISYLHDESLISLESDIHDSISRHGDFFLPDTRHRDTLTCSLEIDHRSTIGETYSDRFRLH
jgi:hypothetical protein